MKGDLIMKRRLNRFALSVMLASLIAAGFFALYQGLCMVMGVEPHDGRVVTMLCFIAGAFCVYCANHER